MALQVAVASFLWNSADTPGTNYDVTLGFKPKFYIVISTGANAANTPASQTMYLGMGVGTDADVRRTAVTMAFQPATAESASGFHSETAVLGSSTGATGGLVDALLDVEAVANWPSDGIRFTVDDAPNSSRMVTVIGFGGSDITAYAVGSAQEPAATGSQDVAHGLGTTPTGALLFSVALQEAPPGAEGSSGAASFGFSLGAYDGTDQWVVMEAPRDGAGTTSSRSYARNGEIIAMMDRLTAGTLTGRAAMTGMDGTNLTLNWTAVGSDGVAQTRYFFWLAWAGGQFKVSSTTTATDTTPFDGPTAGFTPAAALFASASKAASAAGTMDTGTQYSIGAASSASERAAHAMHNQSGIADANISASHSDAAVYQNLTTAAAVQGAMDISDMSSDPMELVMDDADPSASFVGVAIWGASPGGGGGFKPHFVRSHNVLGQGLY